MIDSRFNTEPERKPKPQTEIKMKKQISKNHLSMNANAIVNRLARLKKSQLKGLDPHVAELLSDLIDDASEHYGMAAEFRKQQRAMMELSLKHGKRA
jgi:hypothetical protein